MLQYTSSFILLLFLTKLSLTSCEGGSSLTFVIDDSGSMEDDIDQVRRGASGIMDIMLKHKSSQIKDIVLVTFNDPIRLTLLRKKTRDRNELQASLNAIVAHNEDNYDWPELSMSGIELALQESEPGSYLYVFTDASAKDYRNVDIVKNLCQKTQSQIIFVLTDYCNSKYEIECIVYHEVAEACSGQVFIVNKNEISKVLEYVKETVKGDKNIITTRTVPPFKKTAIQFVVDDKTEYALISVAGDKVKISDMRGPSSNYETILSTTNVQVLKLSSPVPGLYELNVYGESKVSVIIFGRTDFIFDHGFSEMTPKSLQDTSKQPISGTNNHLSISVTDPDHEVNINSAQILNMKEEIIFELPLRKTSNDFYITDHFVAPNSMFKVAVIGKVIKTGKDIRRIAKTPVEPQKPKIKPIEQKAPVSYISEGLKMNTPYNSTFQLTCIVSGYPEPTIIWKDDKGQVLQSESYPVELPYKYISYLSLANMKKSEKFHCYGSNKLDNTHSSIDVTVLPAFTVDANSKAPLNVNYGKEAVIHCKIQTSLPHRIYWYRTLNNKHLEQITSSDIFTISSNESEFKITNMKIDLQGKYTCKAVLVADENVNAIFDTEVKINDLAKPEIKQSNPTITVKEKTHVSIPCIIINGNPKPKISWQFVTSSGALQPLPNSREDNNIEIDNSQLHNAGHYTCTAENELGKVQQHTVLIVEAPPTIITDNKKDVYVAAVGDKVLKIPCEAVGYPKPVIAWKAFGHPINTDNKYAVEQDGTLAIKKPVEKDSNHTYICEATNKLGRASENFDVIVTSYLIYDDQFGNDSKIYLLRGESKQVKCILHHGKTDSVRWYKNSIETNITEPFLDFINATEEYDGNYTCRVSNDFGSNSHTYEVDVGFAPEFKLNYVPTEIDWKGNRNDIINCDSIGKPVPMIKWTYNGKQVKDVSDTRLKIINRGDYTCEISNPHGGTKRIFKVSSKDCLIDRKNNAVSNMPLIQTNSPTWRDLETQNEFLILKSKVPLKLSCNNQVSKPNTFASLSSKIEVTATCDHNDDILVDGKVYDISGLGCKSKVMPDVVRTGTKCLYDNTELIKVGFKVDGFINVYEVCYDTTQNLPLYTRVKMSDVNNFPSVSEHTWYIHPGIGDSKSDKRYTCQKGSESCCYSKSQLISANDVNYGPPQTSTFIDHLNAIPVWQPCDNNRIAWQSLEDIVRNKYDEESEFTVWSGTSKHDIVNGTIIPRYLWKVVVPVQSDALAMVYVNDPAPVSGDIMCEDVCDENVDPWDKRSNKFTYCCNLKDFVKAFNFTINLFN